MRSALLVLCSALLFSTGVIARRSCGSASCPLSTLRPLQGGWFSLGLSHEYIRQDQIYVGSSRSFVGAIPGHHDEIETLNEKNVIHLLAGLTDRLSLEVQVPFVHREHRHLGHEDSLSVPESWNFSGLGDVVLSAHYTLLQSTAPGIPVIRIDGAFKSSSGVTDAANNEGEEAEATLQPGTGSVDGVIGLHVDEDLATVPTLNGKYASLPLSAGLSCQFTGKGKDDYKFGGTFLAHIGASYQCLDRAAVLLQVNGRFQDYADVGLTGEPRGNTGGTWIYVSPGIGLELSDELAAIGYVQLPVYQDVHGIQQAARYNLFFQLNYSFDLNGGE